jgi:sarcosine oxidase
MGNHVIVVGAGAWGTTSALQLIDRGHQVTLVERFGSRHPYASHTGSTRLWRLADTQPWRARSILYTLGAMERLSDRLKTRVFRRTGFLWRDDTSLPQVREAADSIGVDYQRIDADRVDEVVSGLRSDGRDGLYFEDGGVVYPDVVLGQSLQAFVTSGGTYLPETRVVSVVPGETSATVKLADGTRLLGDQVLLTAGPGTRELLPGFGIELPLKPYTEQLVFFGDPGLTPPAPDLPGFVDCPTETSPGCYAMPNGDEGYKMGLDRPLRALKNNTLGEDLDRTPDPVRTRETADRIRRSFQTLSPKVLKEQVCTWTDSGDGDFIIGRTHPTAVLACGDSGEGFKYSAYLGEYLADLVEGAAGDAEFQRHWTPSRFADGKPRGGYGAIGRH